MNETGKKPRIALTKRTYEKPVLIILNAGDTQGKFSYRTWETNGGFAAAYGPS